MPRRKSRSAKRKSPKRRSRARHSPRSVTQYEKAYEHCLKLSLESAKRSKRSRGRRRTPTRASRKRAPSAYNKFVAKYRRQGKSFKSAARLWQEKKREGKVTTKRRSGTTRTKKVRRKSSRRRK